MTQPRVIFVFGSNLAGIHAGGAAAEARRWWGAVDGRGVGHHGESYAIPTIDTNWQRLPLDAIARHVDTFKLYAEGSPELTFYVTPVGCGIAGYTPAVIAPLFAAAPPNVQLPAGWRTESV